MEQLGGRVTVGDVAARAGVKISEAEEALNALAADCNGSIQVHVFIVDQQEPGCHWLKAA